MQPWISKRLLFPPIIEAHSQALPRHPGTTLCRVYRPQAVGGGRSWGERYVMVGGFIFLEIIAIMDAQYLIILFTEQNGEGKGCKNDWLRNNSWNLVSYQSG